MARSSAGNAILDSGKEFESHPALTEQGSREITEADFGQWTQSKDPRSKLRGVKESGDGLSLTVLIGAAHAQ